MGWGGGVFFCAMHDTGPSGSKCPAVCEGCQRPCPCLQLRAASKPEKKWEVWGVWFCIRIPSPMGVRWPRVWLEPRPSFTSSCRVQVRTARLTRGECCHALGVWGKAGGGASALRRLTPLGEGWFLSPREG